MFIYVINMYSENGRHLNSSVFEETLTDCTSLEQNIIFFVRNNQQ